MTFAIIMTGGKQYKVSEGQKVKIEKLKGDLKAGDKVTFDSVLLVEDGKKTSFEPADLEGKKVSAVVVRNAFHPKVLVTKYKAKSRYLKRNGHKQPFTEVEITNIA